jgi:hypothetical protein
MIVLVAALFGVMAEAPRPAMRLSHAPEFSAILAPSARVVQTDSVRITADAVLAISEFFIEWQRLWRTSAVVRAQALDSADRELRLPYLHCHRDVSPESRAIAATNGEPTERFVRTSARFAIVASEYSEYAVCPSWIFGSSVPDVQDERLSRDGALVLALRPVARAARARLLIVLDSAARALPHSGFLVGQRVRFLLEQRDGAGAVRATQNCLAERWWCLALAGYVQDRLGASLEADSIYRIMERVMRDARPIDSLRHWDDVRPLVSSDAWQDYDSRLGEERIAAVKNFWWLSDPLFREAGNERWTAHQTRRVDIALRSALDGDERYVWDTERGGDALRQLILRYDWPSYTWWDSRATDVGHSEYLWLRRSRPVPPYSTFEYSLDRVRFTPAWTAAAAPFSAQESDWDIAPREANGGIDATWWAPELVRPRHPMVQLPEGQTVLLRRDTNIVLVTSHNLTSPAIPSKSSRFDVLLLAAQSENLIDTVAHDVAASGGAFVMRAVLGHRPVVMSVEAALLDSTTLSARARFGVQPPPTLQMMRAGDVAISDLAIVRPVTVSGTQVGPSDTRLGELLPSLVLDASERRIGLYWETYGLVPSDSVEIAVEVQPDLSVGTLRRIGMALRIASDPTRSLTIRWTEPSLQRRPSQLPGARPVLLREIALNLEPLAPGPYLLRVSVRKPGGATLSSGRRLVLQR